MAELAKKPEFGSKMEKDSDNAGVTFIETPVKVESARCRRRQAPFKQIGISRNEDGPKGIVVKKTAKPVVVVKPKHPIRIRKQNDKKSKNKKNSGHKLVPYEEIVGKQVASKVELDERTVREWEISMGKLEDSQQGIAEEREREWWEKERESLHERLKSFISNMHLIQGEMKFSQWKGSVLDSIVGAYLTQNVSDILSSSAFMSLAAKYPHPAVISPSETAKIALRSCRSKIKNDKKTYSEKKKRNAVSRKSLLKGKPVDTENPCFKTEKSSRRKRKREDDAIHWNALKKYFCKGDHSRKMTYDNDTSDALDWEAVRMAKVDDIAKAIQKRGMSNNLAARIKNCLNMLENNLGSIDLEWIRDVPPNKAREYLLSIPGLGLKSVECIRLLTLLQNAFPIDTNAGRVSVRLGWVPIQPLPQGQQFHLLKEYPKANSVQKYLWPRLSKLDESTLYELHCQMITLGKVFCTKRNPNCNACPMRAECKHYASILESSQLAQLALRGVPEKNDMHSSNPTDLAESSMVGETAMVPIQCVFPKRPQGSDELKLRLPIEWDIEDFGLNRTPQISADDNIQKFINEKSIPLQEGEISKALMVLNSESASVAVSKLKNATYLRTEHQV